MNDLKLKSWVSQIESNKATSQLRTERGVSSVDCKDLDGQGETLVEFGRLNPRKRCAHFFFDGLERFVAAELPGITVKLIESQHYQRQHIENFLNH